MQVPGKEFYSTQEPYFGQFLVKKILICDLFWPKCQGKIRNEFFGDIKNTKLYLFPRPAL